jgi:hypothetical protein
MGAVLFSAERSISHTVDEPGHLVRGLAWWWAEDTRLDWPHPPLGQLLATAPVALVSDPVDFESFASWDEASFAGATYEYWRRYDEARRQLRIARHTMAALSILLAIYLYEWIRRRYGERLALLTTVTYAANPMLLAHAGLMTTDFPLAFFTLIALLQLHDYLLDRSWWRVLTLAAAIGALVTTKHTGILIAILLLPPALLFAARRVGRFAGLSRSKGFGLLARDATFALLAAFLSVNAVYKFDETGLSGTEIVEHAEPSSWLRQDVLNEEDHLPPGLHIPVPFNYLFGAEFIRTQNARGHAGFFMGRKTKRGTPGYFPLMLVVKSPIGVLALILAGLVLAIRQRFRDLPLDVWLHAYLVVFFLALTYHAQINIGVRHALLVVPSLTCLAGRGANALWVRRPPFGRWAAATCLVSVVAGAALGFPDYIGDFNWLVGGRSGGLRISVVGEDWGQDTARLGTWQKETAVPVAYFTRHRLRYAEVKHAGGEVRRLKCGEVGPEDHWTAIHITEIARKSMCVRAYLARDPEIVLNDHILLYPPFER